MRHLWILLITMGFTTTGCWLGSPYEPLQFCLDTTETTISTFQEDGLTVYQHSGKLVSQSWNDDWEEPLGDCGLEGSGIDLPEHILKIKSFEENSQGEFDYTRFGYTIPEMEIPYDLEEENIPITLRVLRRSDPESWAFVVYYDDCPDPHAGNCKVEIIVDEGLGGPLVTDSIVQPFTIRRGDKVARQNGTCGKVEYQQIEFKGGGQTIAVNPGSFDAFKVEEESDTVDYFGINVDTHTWDIDTCGDAQESLSYVVMRE